jgi:RNA polymerase sigma-70 factor (ECF subfamily)
MMASALYCFGVNDATVNIVAAPRMTGVNSNHFQFREIAIPSPNVDEPQNRTRGFARYHAGLMAGLSSSSGSWESTLSLLTRARAGDDEALNDLFGRYLPVLRRWASGRLPRWARDVSDTHDLVQETLLHTFRKIDAFDHRGEGALQAYLRQAVMNRIRDELRRADRRPAALALDSGRPDPGLSPLEAAIGAEVVERYEAALDRLSADDRELIVARVEFGMTYAELAQATGKPSSDAARMAIGRALIRLAEELRARPLAD